MVTSRVYLDHNATVPLIETARDAVMSALDAANPSSVHREGRAARRIVETARASVGALAGQPGDRVIFTSGATEGASLLLSPDWRMGRAALTFSRLYVTASDHPCILTGGRFGADRVTRLGVDAHGVVRIDALEAALASHDKADGLPLVALHGANNETGVIQPLAAIAEIVRRAGGTLVVDAVQMAGRCDLAAALELCDFIILSAHKIGGPKGVGAVIGRSDVMMPLPLVGGGGQERGFRAGTENVHGIAGFGAAATEAADWKPKALHMRTLRDAFEAGLLRHAPDAVVHGMGAERLPNTTFVSLPGIRAETAQIAFDLAGIAVSSGSACSSGKVGPSHVLEAMGAKDARGAIRISTGPETTVADIEKALQVVGELSSRARATRAA